MDMKILAGAIAISLIAFVGIAFAMPDWHMGAGDWTSSGFNATGNSTGPPGPGFGRGGFDRNRTMHNNTMNCTGPRFNTTDNFMRPPRPGLNPEGNQTVPEFNSSQLEEFKQAIEAGDYQTAKQLHETYHLGGLLFDKLTETTFAKYSQIYGLQNELMQELGLEEPGIGPRFDGFGRGPEPGFAHGMRNYGNHRATKPVADLGEEG